MQPITPFHLLSIDRIRISLFPSLNGCSCITHVFLEASWKVEASFCLLSPPFRPPTWQRDAALASLDLLYMYSCLDIAKDRQLFTWAPLLVEPTNQVLPLFWQYFLKDIAAPKFILFYCWKLIGFIVVSFIFKVSSLLYLRNISWQQCQHDN